MASQEDVKRLVGTFCSELSNDVQTKQSMEAIISHLKKAELNLAQLVECSGEQLTSTNDVVRNLGTRLLAEVIPICPPTNPKQLSTLLLFFSERMKDEPCVKEVLRGTEGLLLGGEAGLGNCALMIRSDPECAEAGGQVLDTMLKDVHVQALSLSDRGRVYHIVEGAAFGHCVPLTQRFVQGFTHAMDGERDPRNLRICFKIVPKIASRGLLVSTELADGLFGVCSCYFPITFTPPPNDTVGITTEMLKTDMLECLASSHLFAAATTDLALGKLAASESNAARLDSMDLMAAMVTRYGVDVGLAGSARQVWSALRLQMVDGQTEEAMQRARSCLLHILRAACVEEEQQQEQQEQQNHGAQQQGMEAPASASAAQAMLGAIKMQCLVELKTADDPRCRKSTLALQCCIAAHPASALAVLPAMIELLCNGYSEGASANLPIARRLSYLHVLYESLLSSRVLSAYVSEQQSGGADHSSNQQHNVMLPYVQQVFTVACDATAHGSALATEGAEGGDGPALEILAELCIQGLLSPDLAAQAAGHIANKLCAGSERCANIGVKLTGCEATLPLVLSSLLPPLLDRVSSGTQDETLSQALGSLCCAHKDVLEAACPTLLAMAKQERGMQVLVLVSRGAEQVESAADSELHSIRCSMLIKEAVPAVLAPLLAPPAASVTPIARRSTINAATELLSNVVRATAAEEEHAGFCGNLFTSLAASEELLPLLCATLINCGRQAVLDCEALLSPLIPLSLRECSGPKGGGHCTTAVCSIINKGGERAEQAIQARVLGQVCEAARSGDEGACILSGHLAEACLMRGHKAGAAVMDILFSLLSGPNAGAAAMAYGKAVESSQGGGLTASCHAVEKPIWKQKLFHKEQARLSEAYRAAPANAKGAFLSALSQLLTHIPRSAYQAELPTVIPLLVQALKLDDATSLSASLSLLFALTQHDHSNHAPGSCATATLLEGQINTLIPALIDASKLKTSLKVRCLALDCLSSLPSLITFQRLFPYRKQVTNDTAASLEDHKRCVRSRAAKCRNTWFMI